MDVHRKVITLTTSFQALPESKYARCVDIACDPNNVGDVILNNEDGGDAYAIPAGSTEKLGWDEGIQLHGTLVKGTAGDKVLVKWEA